MYITWTSTNDMGEVETYNHPTITTENARSYAKKTCCTCWGKGYNHYDNGWENVVREDDNGNFLVDRQYVNPRNILCECSIRTIQRTGL